jgi:uroporphyrinogen decarboxylase
MRQAGRYLPEYREARAKAGSFWNLCMTPERAAEVTMQPVRRFGLDAAILFSDILLVPFALGRQVSFNEGEGPRLEKTISSDELRTDVAEWEERLAPVYDALQLVDSELDAGTDLLGFAGGAWTLAAYMCEGRGSVDQRAAKLWGYRDPAGFVRFLDRIASCVAHHLVRQTQAGATVVQIFDSSAGGLSEQAFAEWVIAPTRRIVEHVREANDAVKIIGFPRGATLQEYERYAEETNMDGVCLDPAISLDEAAKNLGKLAALEGNLDPIALLAGGSAMSGAIERMLGATAATPFIANLGHGVLPETPVEHVAQFVEQVRRPR